MAPATLHPGMNLVQGSFDQGGGGAGIRVGVYSGTNLTLLDPAEVEVVADPFGPADSSPCISIATAPSR